MQKEEKKKQNGQQKKQRGRPPKAAVVNKTAADYNGAAPAETGPAPDKRPSQKKKKNAENNGRVLPVRLTILGGLNEIGKNIAALEYGEDALLIDCGMAFPDDEMLGVDIVLPDFTHIEKIRDRIRGVVITHGHEDHIGGLPYLLREFDLPVYGSKLTLALVNAKLREHGLSGKRQLNIVKQGQIVDFGGMSVEFIPVNHSIPDAMALAIKTPQGYIVHTGDFKIDCTPISGRMIDLTRFGTLGEEGVLALLADSTNAERPGYTPSERVVGESFNSLFKMAESKRIIIATFSSNLHRIQQIVDAAEQLGRKVAVSGRSMITFVDIAQELGYLNLPAGLLIDIDVVNRYPKDEVIIITTGSQGEPMSALTRMAFS
ncbi:MAG: ribonuclease J, partial [Oscillospiraceae bacterium]|nr:ribonuclease J [Oscillospiraceae bacterium]